MNVRRVVPGLLAAAAVLGLVASRGTPGFSDPGRAQVRTEAADRFRSVAAPALAALAAGTEAAAVEEELTRDLGSRYLEPAGPALLHLVESQGLTAPRLARAVVRDPERYRLTGEARLDTGRVRALFRRLARLRGGARFADVHLVTGDGGTGGTVFPGGLVVATELAAREEHLLQLVAHELVHLQQRGRPPVTLLDRALREGSADFLAELLSGVPVMSRSYAWGMAHEARVWDAFLPSAGVPRFRPWFGRQVTRGRPDNLGYFVGYRIVEAWWHRQVPAGSSTADSARAVAGILAWDRADRFAEASGYRPGPVSRVLDGARRTLGLPELNRGLGPAPRVTEAGVGADGPPPAAALAPLLAGHDLHGLVLFPGTRLYRPAFRGRVRLSGVVPPLPDSALAIRWFVDETDTLTVFYHPADTVPVAVRPGWVEPGILIVLEDWRPVEGGHRLFHRARVRVTDSGDTEEWAAGPGGSVPVMLPPPEPLTARELVLSWDSLTVPRAQAGPRFR